MIKKIKSIDSFAIFRDFLWNDHLKLNDGNTIQDFKQINILYGRNYSGKTTLSRIIRALETGMISSNYHFPQFSVLWADNTESTAINLKAHGKTIRVFNEDFIRENLNFLIDSTNSQGQIKSFDITIGAGNVIIDGEIRELETELGSSEEGKETGLYALLKESKNKQNTITVTYDTAYKALKTKKEEKATGRTNGIKYRSHIFGDQIYDIRKLESDIQTVISSSYIPIDDKMRHELESSLNDMPKPEILPLPTILFDFKTVSDKVKVSVEKKIGDSEKIQELIRNYALNEWVKKGRELHKDRLKVCAFCGNEISSARWDILEKHFDEETECLERELSQLIDQINRQKQAVENGLSTVVKESFYAMFHIAIDELHTEYEAAVAHYCGELDKMIQQLENRKREMTQNLIFSIPEDFTSEIEMVFNRYEQIRVQSNMHTNTLSNIKREAQQKLRLHEVRIFVDTVDYISETNRIKSFEIEKQNAETATQMLQSDINRKLQTVEDKKGQRSDEGNGAQKVNEYLNHYFGHQFLTLKPITDESTENKQVHFEIFRRDQRAFNLSEGECNLISFCYFMAKLEDKSTAGKQPIIWIDDPISSFDGNHIFFAYSLLQAEIVDKKMFEQLFVSTHNLDFLKYMKRLNGKYKEKKNYEKAWLVVERTFDNAIIKKMPKYLKEYITEFNYLFQQIYKCSKAIVPDDDNYAIFYNFGNNLRKFLDIYLYYKYPDGEPEEDSQKMKMSLLFGDKVVEYLTDRLKNEYSHLSGTFERGQIPVVVPEMQSIAQKVIETLKRTDKKQYTAFLKSIGEIETEIDEDADSTKVEIHEKSEKTQKTKKGETHDRRKENDPNQSLLFE
jgi:wobble nucleotide-excising tRNase